MTEKNGRKRPFAVFDIDGTLIRWQLYHAVADALAKRQLIDQKDYELLREARLVWKKRAHPESFRAYERQLVATYKKVLTKLTVEQFLQASKDVFEEYKDQVYTYTRDLIKQLKKDGYLIFAISGSQTEVIERIAEHYRFDDFIGTVYERSPEGRFTGKETHYLGRKHIVLNKLITKYKATLKGSIAVGDSASDISMLEMVEHPIVFNPDKGLFDQAKTQGWKIVLERKNIVYELEQVNGKYVLAKTGR